jgi:AmmeMemoRadiSam system protein B
MTVRRAVVAGQFYPQQPEILAEDVRGYIDRSCVVASPAQVAALVVPHAGYVYSGPTAGFAYARVRGAQPKRVVLLGRSHRYAFKGASIWLTGGYESPLGILPVDTGMAAMLAEEFGGATEEAHEVEHTLEVQAPFVQVAMGAVPIVPVLFGEEAGERHVEFGRRLAQYLETGDLVIASTDLSHYLTEAEANAIDRESTGMVLERDPMRLARGLAAGTCSMCGGAAVVAAMAYASARCATDWRLLDHRTSAHASGDTGHVVGYAAISMEYEERGDAQ